MYDLRVDGNEDLRVDTHDFDDIFTLTLSLFRSSFCVSSDHHLCLYVGGSVCMYVRVCVCVCMCVYVHICMCTCVSACMCM